jgi:CHAT domain-containing protein
LRALAESRQLPAVPAAGERLLLVTVPEVDGLHPLPNVAHERDLLTGRLAGAVTLLDGQVTVEDVESALPKHRWVHFSCHAGQSYDDPSQGGLQLGGGTLTVERISAAERHGEFAFLSACKTAFGGLTLPDEAITLAAALNYSGYRHIIATPWSVYDSTAAQVTEMAYAEMCRSGTFTPEDSAAALHLALRELRDGGRTPLSAWTPFTHTGL